MSPAPGARLIDAILEASVIGSFTRVGYLARRRLFRWETLSSHRLDGQTAVVTGATSGLGRAAAEQLAWQGARVCLVGRDPTRTETARAEIEAVTGVPVEAEIADLSLLADTAALAQRLAGRHTHLDILVLNAGALTHAFTETSEGNEVTLATHVLSQFALVAALRPLLEASSARVISVASGGMYAEPLDPAGLDPEPSTFDGTKAYARCKRAQVTLAEIWTQRLAGTGVRVVTMHPGWADTTGLREALPGFSRLLRPLLRTPAEGAETISWLASAPGAPGDGGGFFLDRRPRSKHRLRRTRRADTPAAASAVWELCARRTAPYTAGLEPAHR